jgi:hypothetical protein
MELTLYSTDDVVKLSKLSRQRFSQLQAQGRGPKVTTVIDGRNFYNLDSVLEWVAQRRTNKTPNVRQPGLVYFTEAAKALGIPDDVATFCRNNPDKGPPIVSSIKNNSHMRCGNESPLYKFDDVKKWWETFRRTRS